MRLRRRPPRASRVLIALSFVVAAVSTMVLRDHLTRVEAAAARPGPAIPVVVAASALGRGAVLSAGDVRLEQLPARYRPPGALSRLPDALGRTLAADVLAGEALTSARLAPPGGPVASLVPPGLRAVTVTVSVPPAAVATGDRVDVLATHAAGRPYTETVVAAAEVLQVVGETSTEVGTATALIVLVSPEDAERLAFARAFADLSVAVVPAGDAWGSHPGT